MKIGIDASTMLVSKKTGIENYATELIESMVRLLPQYSQLDLTFYFYSGNPFAEQSKLEEYLPLFKNYSYREHKISRGYKTILSLWSRIDKLDLLHFPAPQTVRFRTCPVLMTFHDASWLFLDEQGKEVEGNINKNIFESAIHLADNFIAVSNNAKEDLANQYKIPRESIWVVYHGLKHNYWTNKNLRERQSDRFNLGKYIISVGTLQYRKNYPRLLESFDILKRSYGIPHKLVIVGKKGWGHKLVYEKLASLGLEEHVFIFDFISNDDLRDLYIDSDLFIHPSLYEGFGIPILEAMACGTVVASSNRSSLPEVGGNAALYFDPNDTNDIVEKVYLALTDESLRVELRRRGMENVRKFDWEKSAAQTLDVYKQIVKTNFESGILR